MSLVIFALFLVLIVATYFLYVGRSVQTKTPTTTTPYDPTTTTPNDPATTTPNDPTTTTPAPLTRFPTNGGNIVGRTTRRSGTNYIYETISFKLRNYYTNRQQIQDDIVSFLNIPDANGDGRCEPINGVFAVSKLPAIDSAHPNLGKMSTDDTAFSVLSGLIHDPSSTDPTSYHHVYFNTDSKRMEFFNPYLQPYDTNIPA